MKVLLVDDNEINLEIQKYMLESCGVEADTAESGKSALELVKNGSYGMIFMDIQMPEMDGFQAAEAIRRGGGTMPIIALSADKISYDDSRFIRSGMNGSLKKPLQQSDLSKVLSGYPDASEKSAARTDKDAVFDGGGFSAMIPEPSAAAQILEQFFTVHGGDCNVLEKRINKGNILGARELMHDIVGITGNLCCHRLYKAANTLSAELRQGHSDSLGKFAEIWELTMTELRTYCGSLSPADGSDTENVGWDVLWSDFTELCEVFDVAAVKLFRRNIKKFAENLEKNEFEKIKKAIERYDFLTIISR